MKKFFFNRPFYFLEPASISMIKHSLPRSVHRSSFMAAVKTACITICIFCCLLQTKLQAQSFDEIAAQFPGKYAVIQNQEKEINIFLQNGEPVAESKTSIDILILDDRAIGIYNRYRVYHSSFNELKSIEAYTLVPNGKKTNKIKVTEFKTGSSTSGSVFYDDVKESTFDFAQLAKGVIAHVEYTQFHKDVHLLSPFYCVSYMPVAKEQFTVKYAADMELKYNIRNDKLSKVKMSETNERRQHTLTFSAENMVNGESFANAPAYAYYEPHIIIQLAAYTDDNNKKINYLSSLDDLYQWNYHFISKLDNTKEAVLKTLADSITHGLTAPVDKAKAIYRWVQSNIKYVAFEDGLEGFIPRRAADICTRRYGDCKDMSSILTALLQLSGLKAYFTWIGTRDIPYDYSEVALPITDNHMIAALWLDDKWTFLDGTDPTCIFGMPSAFTQGKQALIAIGENDYKIVRVPEMEAEKNILTDSTFIHITGNGIKGNSSVYYNGYWGSDVYSKLMYSDPAETKQYVKTRMGKASNKFILGDYTINKINEKEKQVNIKADFEVPDYGKKVADELYINMMLEKLFSNEMIDTARRKVGIENEYKFLIKQYTILEVPGEYKVSYLPKDFSSSNDLFAFTIQYKKQDNKIIALQEVKNNNLLLQPKDFALWNNTLRQVINQYKEQVVLQKGN